MRYSDIKRETLSHINQYTMAGDPISPFYNNQADYLKRIPVLINEALVSIRTLVKPDPVVLPLTYGEKYGDMVRYRLPNDFWSLKTGGVTVVAAGRFRKTNEYQLQGKKYILVPQELADRVTVEYYKYPPQLPLDAADDFNLDEEIDVLQAATYYAAANLVLHDDETMYSYLFNDYESRLSRLSNGVTVEVQPVQDSYAFYMG